MWTLDNAIQYYKIKSEEMFRIAKMYRSTGDVAGVRRTEGLAYEYKQTSEWLKELKERRIYGAAMREESEGE